MAIERGMRLFEHLGVVGQAEVVVGAEVDDLAGERGLDRRCLRRRQHALLLVQAGFVQAAQFAAQVFEEILAQRGGSK